jgi:putative endonuclease
MRKRSSKSKGSEGEEIAAHFLEKLGYTILEKNYRTKFGEIDLIGKDGDTIAFIEVKLRSGKKYGAPSEAVDHKKRTQIGRLALYFLSRKKMEDVLCRFDTVSLLPNEKGNYECELIKDAFRIE